MKPIHILESKKVPFRLIPVEGRVITVQDVLAGAKEAIDPDSICKTIIVRERERPVFFALFLPGRLRVDLKKVETMRKAKVTLASAPEVETVTGVPPGAVCPIGLSLPLYIDQKVMGKKIINMGSGDLHYGLEMALKDLLSVLKGYTTADV